MSEFSDTIRMQFQKYDDIRDAGLVTPEDIVRFDDLVYGQDAPCQVLDVYRPKRAEGKALPVIVSVHGGGWVYGDKERYQYYCMSLAQRGFAVVNFTYRLAPEYKYPAQLEDTNQVFTWVMAHAQEYGFDTACIFGVGDSAGAQNLGLYAALCTNPSYASAYRFAPPEGFRLAAVALNCGLYQTAPEKGRDGLMAELLPGGGTPQELEQLNVVNYVTEQFPPTFLMTCQGDFLKMQAPVMARELARRQVPFVYRLYGDAKNPLTHVFHCDMRSDMGRLCNEEECRFFADIAGRKRE